MFFGTKIQNIDFYTTVLSLFALCYFTFYIALSQIGVTYIYMYI